MWCDNNERECRMRSRRENARRCAGADLADDLNVTGDTCAENRSALLRDDGARPRWFGLAVERGHAMERDHAVIRFVGLGDDLVVLRVVRRKETQPRHVL